MEPGETISAVTVLKYAYIWKQFGLSFLITQLSHLGIQDLEICVLLLKHPGMNGDSTPAGVGICPTNQIHSGCPSPSAFPQDGVTHGHGT